MPEFLRTVKHNQRAVYQSGTGSTWPAKRTQCARSSGKSGERSSCDLTFARFFEANVSLVVSWHSTAIQSQMPLSVISTPEKYFGALCAGLPIIMRREREIESWKSAHMIRERLIKLNM